MAVLLESGYAAGMLSLEGNVYALTKLGHVFELDQMTHVNLEFVHHVCYKSLFHLEEALIKRTPAGLKEISSAPTVYEGLSGLPAEIQDAWLSFDHYYSDSAFAQAVPFVMKAISECSSSTAPRLLDVGGNTGKFALECLQFSDSVSVTLCDLPGQVGLASRNPTLASMSEGVKARLGFHSCDMTLEASELPMGADAIWMSQFLVCFSEAEVLSIFQRCVKSLKTKGRVFVLDTFWDRQENPISAFCLIQTSPYFTAVANGKSRMYRSETILALAMKAGLGLVKITDGLGISHSLLEFEVSNTQASF